MMSVHEVIDGLSFFVRPLFAVIAAEMETAYQQAAPSSLIGNRLARHSSFFR